MASVSYLYVPPGSSNDDAQARKDIFMERFTPHMAELLKEKRVHHLCRLEYLPPEHRSQKLAKQPEKLGLYAARA